MARSTVACRIHALGYARQGRLPRVVAVEEEGGRACMSAKARLFLKQLLRCLVLRRPRVKRRDKGLCCKRDMRVVSDYDVLRRDFLSVDSLVCVVVRSDRRTL